ncbi:MAG: purine-binding chemotaxis protein CheW [Chthonomonadaceae bacterium]|nr:purine-binding chemotaxis protein CheW [Chthonomonadaceae bacterium]
MRHISKKGTRMESGKHVIVRLGQELFGIPVLAVETILNDQKVTRVPRAPKLLLGVFELRGRTLSAIDLRTRLEQPPFEGDAKHVVVDTPVGSVSIRVDKVEGIWEFDDVEPSESLLSCHDQFLSGIGKRGGVLVTILDPQHLLSDQLKKKLAAQAA